jgi:hypothetical protein
MKNSEPAAVRRGRNFDPVVWNEVTIHFSNDLYVSSNQVQKRKTFTAKQCTIAQAVVALVKQEKGKDVRFWPGRSVLVK